MAFAATNQTNYPQAFSLGPVKCQMMKYTAATGDTSGTVTADALTSIRHILVDGKIQQTTAVSFSGNVATLTFADPAATISGSILVFGV